MTIMNVGDININEYDYDLPESRIAQHPVKERDKSQLLIDRGQQLSKDIFFNIDKYLPAGSLLVFNNTRVIRARLLFQKESGAPVEILCLEPISPHDYALSFSSKEPVEWKCMIGNLKKWKSGILRMRTSAKGTMTELYAERLKSTRETSIIRFSWNNSEISFGEALELTGHIPLPPYITRADEADDSERYQTVYSKIKGSVAAPTAGLHFTESVLERTRSKGIRSAELTLHVGAGTFRPVQGENVLDHEMHSEHFIVSKATLESLLSSRERIIPVGTTSVRTLESIYWIGVKLLRGENFENGEISLGQWEPYGFDCKYSVNESIGAVINYLEQKNELNLMASTRIIIVPGYEFRLTSGMITNFHQPRSTLLLLVAAWAGERWKDIYSFALDNGFRFLSYGDSSLLLR